MDSSFALAIIPFLLLIFLYLLLATLGLFILYLIIRAAINNSKLNQTVELLHMEILKMNHHISTLQTSILHAEKKDK